ncbi:MAG TPA: hypothetical protein VHU19_14345 [Pyrinomonadaceae bacterium]|jgi:hypothetical protein|nr:hypothetical protein [Pyrinomonadaceae bacterium]
MATPEGKIDDKSGDKGSSFAQERAASTQTGSIEAEGGLQPGGVFRSQATQTGDIKGEGQAGYIPFAETGRTFAKWFNDALTRANKPTIALGTKTATVIMLRDDGVLVVDVDGEDVKGDRQHVALDAAHLNALMPQLKG